MQWRIPIMNPFANARFINTFKSRLKLATKEGSIQLSDWDEHLKHPSLFSDPNIHVKSKIYGPNKHYGLTIYHRLPTVAADMVYC